MQAMSHRHESERTRNTGTLGNEEERHETQVDLGPRCTNIDRMGQFHHNFDWVGFGSLVWFESYNFTVESRHITSKTTSAVSRHLQRPGVPLRYFKIVEYIQF
jgi:hypothetical protein